MWDTQPIRPSLLKFNVRYLQIFGEFHQCWIITLLLLSIRVSVICFFLWDTQYGGINGWWSAGSSTALESNRLLITVCIGLVVAGTLITECNLGLFGAGCSLVGCFMV